MSNPRSASAALPLVLAGPVLRRCAGDGVFVWLALQHSARVTAQIWEATPGRIDAGKPFLGVGQAHTLALGRRLHLVLVPIEPAGSAGAFPAGRLLEYDLVIEVTDERGEVIGDPIALSSFSEFRGAATISYAPYPRPTFFLPDGQSVNLLHGSCRKPHGAGKDALAAADGLLELHSADLVNRPSALLLTGDQIYADDVAEDLTAPIIELGADLMGFDETVPVLGGATVPVRGLVGGARGLLLAKVFTPDYAGVLRNSAARNHLMGFGEFAAMYLLGWNKALWPPGVAAANADLAAGYRTLSGVRRVLANIPSYMILDDHEITDDWNRTRTWEERVEQHPTGRRVVTNAVAAYWAFQGWGNEPGRFPADFASPLKQYVSSGGASTTDYEEAFYPANPDPNDPNGTGGPSRWQYVTPTDPPVIMLDARTRRGFDPNDKDRPAELLGATAIEHLRTLLSTIDVQRRAVILVAPTPVFGVPGMEKAEEGRLLQDTLAAVLAQTGAAAADLESWHANAPALHRVLFALLDAGVRQCVVLSGDVHYGFADSAEFASGGSRVVFTQFTSSALKNTAPLPVLGLLAVEEVRAPIRFEYAWRTAADFVAALGGSVPRPLRERLSRAPVVLSLDELRSHRIPPSAAQAVLTTVLRADDRGSASVTTSNLGQLTLTDLSPTARATLRFLGPDDGDVPGPLTLREITVDLDRLTTPR
ncbi:alkaline phosphatase D family protein [Kitasatospora griseola]|uniref:alkaline phosphatase D family protein n=1 Tax=Kitasatospora griseola TaxID=2064 RepID=UPI00381D6A38